ncbi:uncharacterized protein LOC135091023 [Scylla paramamosain]|uniref:uncharacterized protein LOC135091023 n=1 Tax=Scylla paramamosain TaxID=85552 RepID=UPI0030838DE4
MTRTAAPRTWAAATPCAPSVCSRSSTVAASVPSAAAHSTPTPPRPLPVNYPLLRLSRALASVNLQRGQSEAPSPAPGPTRNQNDAGECAAHLARLTQRCMTCRVWVCRECLLMDHTLPPEGACRLLSVRQAINEMKKTHVETLTAKVLSLRELKTSAATQGGCLEANRRIRNAVAATLQAAARAELDAVKELDTKKKEVEDKVAEIDVWMQGLREKGVSHHAGEHRAGVGHGSAGGPRVCHHHGGAGRAGARTAGEVPGHPAASWFTGPAGIAAAGQDHVRGTRS